MSSDGGSEDGPGMEGVQNDVVDLYRMVEELLKMGKKIVGQMKGVGKEVGQCGRRGKEMLAEVPVSGLVINIFMAIYVFVALMIMFWWGRRVVVKFLDILGSGISGLKREIRERGRNKSRSLPTVSPLVLPGGGLLNQNWQPLRGRQSLARSPEKEKRSRNPFHQTEAVVHGVGGDTEAVPPAGAEALLPAGTEALPTAGAEALLPAGAGNFYENVRESPIRPFQSVPNLLTEDGYLVPVRNHGNIGDGYSSDEDVNVTSKTYVSAMSLRSGREMKPVKPGVKRRL